MNRVLIGYIPGTGLNVLHANNYHQHQRPILVDRSGSDDMCQSLTVLPSTGESGLALAHSN